MKVNSMKALQSMAFILAILALTLSSCSKKLNYFTQDLYEEYDWSVDELKRVQFYLSEDIVLYRELESESVAIDDGKIKFEDGRKVEEVVFEKGTPGVLSFSPKENRFAVSFDDDDRFLMFGPNEKAGGRFVLLAKDWDRRVGKVTYGDLTYRTSTSSAFASLLVDVDKVGSTDYRKEKVGGRKVN